MKSDVAKSAGRGVLLIAGAKAYFVVAGTAIQFALPRLLERAESFGLYSTAMNIASILNNVLIAATVQGVSKHIGEDLERSPATLRQGLKLQGALGAFLASSLYALAPFLSENILLDPKLTPLIRITAFVVFSYALYATLVGALNGRRLFHKQALLDISFSTLRLGGILGGAYWTTSALGAVSGFAAAAIAIMLVAFAVTGIGKNGAGHPIRKWAAFLVPIWIYQAALNGMLQIDLWVIKRTVAELHAQAGASLHEAADTASKFAAYYRGAQTFAFVPYQLILAVTFVLFPFVLRAQSSGDIEETRQYIKNALRFSLIVLCAIAAPVMGAAHDILRVPYPAEYQAGSVALSILTYGMVAFALFVIAATILSGVGRPAIAAAIATVSFLVVVACNRAFILFVGADGDVLAAAATGTSVGTTFALLAAAFAVHRMYRAFLGWLTVLRVLIASAITVTFGLYVPLTGKIGAILKLGAGGIVFLGVLALLRELGPADWGLLQRVIGRRGSR